MRDTRERATLATLGGVLCGRQHQSIDNAFGLAVVKELREFLLQLLDESPRRRDAGAAALERWNLAEEEQT